LEIFVLNLGREVDWLAEMRADIELDSFFREQEGDFELTIRSIAAIEEEVEAPYRDNLDGRRLMEVVDEKRELVVPARPGWLGWIFGACVKL
jgi:hypothetical protein